MAAAGSLLAALSGCYAGTAGAVLGIQSLADGNGRGLPPDVPAVRDLRAVTLPGIPRPLDLDKVEISFYLVERTGEPASVRVEFSTDGSWSEGRPATISGSTDDLPTSTAEASPSGVPPEHLVLAWNAAADGFHGYNRVSLRVTPRDQDGVGAPGLLADLQLGNEQPMAAVKQPFAGASVSQNVVIEFILSDAAGDPAAVKVWYRTGDPSAPARIPPELLQGNTAALLPGEVSHFLNWDSVGTLGRKDVDGLRVGVQPSDDLGSEIQAEIAWSSPFRLKNNAPPQVVIIEPAALADNQGSVVVRYTLRDEERDAADVILQWSTTRNSFPDISDLAADRGLRLRILADPDAWPAYQVVTPRMRTLLEARCRVPVGGSADEVILTGIHGGSSSSEPPPSESPRPGSSSAILHPVGGRVATGRFGPRARPRIRRASDPPRPTRRDSNASAVEPTSRR